MAAMMLMLKSALLKLISINIIAAISWPPPLISQLFHPGFLRPHQFFSAWLFLCGYICIYHILHWFRKVNKICTTFTPQIKGKPVHIIISHIALAQNVNKIYALLPVRITGECRP